MERAEEQNDPGGMTFEQFIKRAPELTVLTDHPLTAAEAFDADAFNFRYKLGLVYDIIRNAGTRTPMAILISGGWGTGKTSAMKWLQGLLNAWNKVGTTGLTKVRPVWFYPWKYDNEDDVRRGLIASVILNAIDVKTASWKSVRKALKLMATFLGKSTLDLVEGQKISIDGFEISGSAIKKIAKNFREAAHPETSYLNPFETAMEAWVEDSLGKNQRMIMFIDDLDRCMPDVALMVLESIKLYLNIPNLIFVLGVDKQVIGNLVVEHYTKLGLVKKIEKGDSVDDKKQRKEDEDKARLYLSKMFQVEVELDPTEQQISDFLEKQLTDIPYWTDSLSDSEQDLYRDLVLKSVGRNPREVKRLLNSALMKGTGSVLTKKDGIKFNQGLQLFFVRRILAEHGTASDAGSKRGIEFFVQWSRIICDAREKNDEKLPLTVKISGEDIKRISQIQQESAEASEIRGIENRELTEAFLNEALISKLDLSTVPKEYLKLLMTPTFSELLHLLANEDLGQLMQIPYPAEVAEIAALAGRTQDADVVRKAVAHQLGKKPDELTDDDYRSVRFLNISGTGVSDLHTLGRLSGLTHLDLSDTSVSDLLPLETLKSLQSLKLANTQIKGIEPLRNLYTLERLNVAGTSIENIHPLEHLENLTLLGLADTNVSDLQPIRNLRELNWLDLRDTQVTDLEPIAGLSSLRSLYISGAKVSSLEHLLNLKGLLTISISAGQYRDLSFLADLPALHELILVGGEAHDLAGIGQGQSIHSLEFADTNVANLQPLQELPQLRTLGLTRTPVCDVESLKTLTNLETLILFGTDLTDEQEAALRKALPDLEIMR